MPSPGTDEYISHYWSCLLAFWYISKLPDTHTHTTHTTHTHHTCHTQHTPHPHHTHTIHTPHTRHTQHTPHTTHTTPTPHTHTIHMPHATHTTPTGPKSIVPRLPPPTQRRVLELLWHLPQLETPVLSLLTQSIHSGRYDIHLMAYLIQIVHHR